MSKSVDWQAIAEQRWQAIAGAQADRDAWRAEAELSEQNADTHRARAERAEQERDDLEHRLNLAVMASEHNSERADAAEENVKAREEMINRLAAEQSRGFTVEDVDDAMVRRALDRNGQKRSEVNSLTGRTMRTILTAALTEPTRPEWEEEGAKALTVAVWGMNIPNEAGEAGDKLAASLARHGYKVVPTEEQP